MRVHKLSANPAAFVVKKELCRRKFCTNALSSGKLLQSQNLLAGLPRRRWLLSSPESKINEVLLVKGPHKSVAPLVFSFSCNSCPSLGANIMENKDCNKSFYVVRDDLLHPLVNGNKARKLDALLPLLEENAVTDVVTCGGCQSAHAAAIAVSCAERGLRSHLLLRGEQPEIPTGYNLISTLYGNITYIARSLYANREEMLNKHAAFVAEARGSVMRLTEILKTAASNERCKDLHVESGGKRVAIVNEGAGEAVGLLGVIRLVEHLSQTHLFGRALPLKLVVDAGTGTTAVGLGLGVFCLGLPWEVTAVMLADTIEGYKTQEKHLISEFKRLYASEDINCALNGVDGGIVQWVNRLHPRKFGNVLKGEVEMSRLIAQQTGILVDPVYTLAAWEQAMLLCEQEAERGVIVVMLHTGGTLGMFGLAQRYKSYFYNPECI